MEKIVWLHTEIPDYWPKNAGPKSSNVCHAFLWQTQTQTNIMANGFVPEVVEKRDGKEIFSMTRALVRYDAPFQVKDVTYGAWRWNEVSADETTVVKQRNVRTDILLTLSLQKTMAIPKRNVDGSYVTDPAGNIVVERTNVDVVWPLQKMAEQYYFVGQDGSVERRLPAEATFGKKVLDLITESSDRITADDMVKKVKALFKGVTLVRRLSSNTYVVREREYDTNGQSRLVVNSAKHVSYFEQTSEKPAD